jgi:APA family basic amino acid/polyamine antiporter
MNSKPKRELSLFDSTCLIAGIIIGVGIYQTAPDVARGAGSWWGVLAIWLVGGLLSLFGALGYAELASAYPREGGDYVYLSRAYGPWAGFLFGWIQTTIVRPGDIAVIAFAFATYGRALYDPLAGTSFPQSQRIYACAAVLVLTLINIAGVRQGKWVQNVLTIVKVAGLLGIIGLALAGPQGTATSAAVAPFPLSIALILVLFTFGGWNEMAYVAAEVKRPKRNIVRALILGTVSVTGLYLLINGAFLHTLGYARLATSEAVAVDAVSGVLPRLGGRLVSALICISALGVVNGLIFAGSRISYAVGSDHRAFGILGRWDPKTGTPVRALLVQAGIAIGLVLILGSFIDAIIYTAAAVYCFYAATTLAVIVLRRKEREVERPYRMTGYPVTPVIFAAVCAFLVYSAIIYKPWIALASVGVFALGLPVYRWSRRQRSGE